MFTYYKYQNESNHIDLIYSDIVNMKFNIKYIVSIAVLI